MRRWVIPAILLMFLASRTFAAHIAGGEMSYKYLGSSFGGTVGRYSITLRLYRDCFAPSSSILEINAAITIYARGSLVPYQILSIPRQSLERTSLTTPGPCIINPPPVCYEIGTYNFIADLPMIPSGYDITYQRCCRIDGIANISNSGAKGATYTATIPGLQDHPTGPLNSSPVFTLGDTVLVCGENNFKYDFSAVDAEGDLLVYELAEAYDYVLKGSDFAPEIADPAPYPSLPYSFGYSYQQPMGPGVVLDPTTGMMSGKAPVDGVYVVTVNILEYRDNRLINRHRKDLHIRVADCSLASVDLEPSYVTCDGFKLTFQNNNNSPLIKTYYWEFGVPGPNNSSTLPRPTFTFPNIGDYTVKLYINRYDACPDSGITIAKVYPGFFPEFAVDDGCKNVPLAFKDLTTTNHGVINYWRWTFGHPLVNPRIDSVKNPTYTYPEKGTYEVQLIVGSSKGCLDTLDKTVTVLDKPDLKVTKSQPLCLGESLQLEALGTGSFSWSPTTDLTDGSISNPVASPKVKTKYYVTLTNAPGCVNRDSVEIDVKSFVTLDAGNDTTICLTDEIRLRPSTDGVNFRWEPAATLDDPDVLSPLAKPTGTTTYEITSWIGNKKNCIAKDAVRVTTIPYPTIIRSPDTTICYGDTAFLRAAGGIDYRWTPTSNLAGNNSPTPLAWPLRTTTYRVAVTDNVGCPKPSFANVVVNVTPRILANAGRDTAIVVGEPFRMMGSGGDSYRWSPPTGLSDPNTANPKVDLNDDQTYVLKVMTVNGCFAFDTVSIRVFKSEPDIFVPTAFSPNGDRLNDILTPIPVGIREFGFFRVFNRWGQLVFSTTDTGKGWDGYLNGREQGTNLYLWHVRGVDFTGRVIDKKGTTTLVK